MSFLTPIGPQDPSKEPFSGAVPVNVNGTFGRVAASPNGFGGVRKIIQQSDVTIYSDNHAESATIYKDMLSPEKLKAYKADGVKDIYVEGLVNNGPVAKAYAEGRITKEQALEQFEKNGTSEHIDPITAKQQNSDLLDAVANAKKEGITIHFAQIPILEHQKAQLEPLHKKFFTINDEKLDIVSKAIDKIPNPSAKDIDALYSKDLTAGFDMTLTEDQRLEAQGRYVRGVQEQLGSKMSQKEMGQFFFDLQKKYHDMQENDDNIRKLESQFRIDNDGPLSDMITQTRTPGSRTIVMHGRSHGGHGSNDLDDQLAKRGLRTSRIDIDYGSKKSSDHIKDPTPHKYSPNKGSDGTFTTDPSVKSSGFKEPDPTAIATPETPKPGGEPPRHGR